MSRQGACAPCAGPHQPGKGLASHQKLPVPALQLKHTCVIPGNVAFVISLALQNQNLSHCSLNPALSVQGILVPTGRRVH